VSGLSIDRWHKRPQPICPKSRDEPSPCDCGYVGVWVVRHWKAMKHCDPTWGSAGRIYPRCDDCKAGGEGHLKYGGWEERCPRCGDEEQFTYDGELVEQRRNLTYDGTRDHTQDNIFNMLDTADNKEQTDDHQDAS